MNLDTSHQQAWGGLAKSSVPLAPIKVRVVDEHEMFALGLRACLGDHPLVEVLDGEDEPADVAIVSPAVAAHTAFPCPLVVCGDAPSRVAPGNAVHAVLPRSTLTTEHLLAGVHAAAAGLRVAQSDTVSPARIGARALTVLQMLARGADTREISEHLGYSDRTIKTVIRELQVALGARNRVQAVAEGIRQGLI